MHRIILFCFILATTSLSVLQGQASKINLLEISEWQILMGGSDEPSPPSNWSPAPFPVEEISTPNAGTNYWFKIDKRLLPNEGYIRTIGQDFTFFYKSKSSTKPFLKIGHHIPMHRLPIRGKRDFVNLNEFESDQSIIFRVSPFIEGPTPLRVFYYSQESFDQWDMKNKGTQLPFHFLVAGGSIAMLILAGFAIFFFFKGRKNAYLFYALYLITFALYFIRLLEYKYQTPFLWGFFTRGYALAEALCIPMTYILYTYFVTHFLTIKKNDPTLWHIFKYWIGLNTVIILCQIIGIIIPDLSRLAWVIFTIFRFTTIPFVVFVLIRFIRLKHPLSKYVVWGTSMLLVTGMLALFITYIFTGFSHPIWSNTFFIMMIGVLLESFLFALGLGASARLDEIEKINAQEKLIVQLKKEAILEKEIQDSRIQTLTAQMNPHFIFNALNAIQHFILKGEKKTSITYLTKFSRLIRGILENTQQRYISLDKELNMLNSYVQIEQMRFHDVFSYSIELDEQVIPEDTQLPHMVIQPFIENAILHGLAPLKKDGQLNIQIKSLLEQEMIEVIIADNGVGRKKAIAKRDRQPKKHNSISVASITTRLSEIINDPNINAVRYEDLINENGEALGTKVVLKIPVQF